MRSKSKTARLVSLAVLFLLLANAFSGVHFGNSSLQRSPIFSSAALPSASELGMIELGYNAATLAQINVSVPTYTLGDQMWIRSSFNSSVNVILFTPQGMVTANRSLVPNSADLLFTFTPALEYDGNWTLNVSNTLIQNFTIPITFVDPLSHGMRAVLTSYGFQKNQLAAGFSLTTTSGSYGVQGCLLPSASPNVIIVNVPGSPGSKISIQNAGNGSVSISAGVFGGSSLNGSVALEIWIELYYQYSYQSIGPVSSFFSTFEEAALTRPVLISPVTEFANPALQTLVGMRSGTYELRTFFQSGGNLSVVQTTILVQAPGLPWTYLGGCSMSSLNGPIFIASTPLTNSSSEWPTTLFLSYKVEGTTFYLVQPLGIQIGGFALFVNSFQEVPKNIGIHVNVTNGFYEVIGESVFFASLSPTIQINYSLTFGGKVFEKSAPTYYTTFGKQEVDLAMAKVTVTHDGKGYPNASVTLSNNALGSNVTLLTNAGGNTTFFGPSGSYSLLVSNNGSTTTMPVTLVAGQANIEVVSLDPNSGGPSLTLAEIEIVVLASVLAAFGIFGNLWFWIFRNRRRIR